jgi:hypothetical protein
VKEDIAFIAGTDLIIQLPLHILELSEPYNTATVTWGLSNFYFELRMGFHIRKIWEPLI